MNILETKNGDELTLKIEGRLDTISSPALEERLNDLEGVNKLIIDCEDLEYISSSGLRCLLKAQKMMNTNGSMVVTNVNELVSEVFDITGFSDILTIE